MSTFEKRIGELDRRDELRETVIKWKIPNFFRISAKVNDMFWSPLFLFDGASWYLKIFPQGRNINKSEGCVGLYLIRESSGHSTSIEFTLGLKSVGGVTDEVKTFKYVFSRIIGSGAPRFLNRELLYLRKDELVPSGTLTVVCTLKCCPNFTVTGFANTAKVECSYCGIVLNTEEDISSHHKKCTEFPLKCKKCGKIVAPKNFCHRKCETTEAEGSGKEGETTKCFYCKVSLDDNEQISSHLQKCTEFPVNCPTCGDIIALKNWHDHKCQMKESETTEKLLNDLKSMMLSGDHSDAIIRVQEEEFRLHRSILSSRSPYFHSMLSCNMKEKNTGNVTIDDCQPDIFRSYLHFVYTGKVDKLNLENVCDLYELADKYQEDQLKSECLNFMKKTLSVENFCDFTVLAFRHDEKELLENSIKFFTSKMKEIILSVKWQSLLAEYPTQANELLIKAII